MKNCFLVVLGAILLIFVAGCGHYSGKFVNMPSVLQSPEYSVPVKFYVRAVDVKYIYRGDIVKSMDAGEIRDVFAKYYPEVFTDDPNRGLAIEFGMDLDVTSYTTLSTTGTLTVVLTGLTFGLSPTIENYTTPVTIRAKVIDSAAEDGVLSMSGKNTIKSRRVPNMLLGFILQNNWLVPKIEDAVFYNNYDPGPYIEALVLVKGREKQFLSVFIEQLYCIPPEKVRELYLAKMTSGIKMKK